MKATVGQRVPVGALIAHTYRGLVPVACWCGKRFVLAARRDIGVRTYSCGKPGCGP